MREILFRGKRIDNGEWVEGAYFKHDTVRVCLSSDDPKPKHLIVKDGFCDWGFEPGIIGIEVDPTTVGQYTGLCDKNGKKIFEGDIVKSVFSGKFYPVCFGEYTYVNEYGDEENVCGWYNEEKYGYVTGFGCPYNWASVIGNIHDNPELLEGDNG